MMSVWTHPHTQTKRGKSILLYISVIFFEHLAKESANSIVLIFLLAQFYANAQDAWYKT